MKTLWIAYAIVFLAFVDNFSMLPTIGPYTQFLGGNAMAMGAAVATYSVTNLMFNVLGGVMLDRSGRRRLLLVGLAAAATAMALYAGAGNVGNLLLVRLLHGAAGGILVPAVFTMIADLAPMGDRGQAMGRAGALIGSAAVFAPAMAGGLRQAAGFNAVFFTATGLLALGFVVAALKLPETHRIPQKQRPLARGAVPGAVPTAGVGGVIEGPAAGRRRASDGPTALPPTGSAAAAGSPSPGPIRGGLPAACWGIFILTYTLGTLTAFLPDSVESLGYGPGITGLMFTAFGLVAAFVMASPLSQTVERRGLLLPTGAGIAMVALSLAILTVAGQIGWIMAACAIFGIGFGLIFPATSGQVARISGASGRGRAYGMFYAVFSLGVIVGAPIGGLFVSGAPVVGKPFFPALIMTVIGLIVLVPLARQTPSTTIDGDASRDASAAGGRGVRGGRAGDATLGASVTASADAGGNASHYADAEPSAGTLPRQ